MRNFDARALMRVVVLVVGLGLASTGCRKQTWQPYYQLDGQQQVLVAREGDSAYLSDEMTDVIAGLKAAPENARERDQAFALASKLEAERARVKSEREGPANTPKPVETAVAPPVLVLPKPPPEADPVDGGPAAPLEPVAGMSEDDFLKNFGACFSAGGAVPGPDGGAGSSQVVKDTPECRKRFGKPEGTTSWLFVKEGGLYGSRTQVTTTTVVVIDAGPPPPPPERDPSKTIRLMPGQPLPEGYVAIPPPDAG